MNYLRKSYDDVGMSFNISNVAQVHPLLQKQKKERERGEKRKVFSIGCA
jgi:hypothetical protein